MTQRRAISALEALVNIFVGWIVAFITQLLVFPVMGLSVSIAQHLGIGAAFTAVSFLRSYCLRRLFERLARRGVPPGGRVNLRELNHGTGGGRYPLSKPDFGPGVGKGKGEVRHARTQAKAHEAETPFGDGPQASSQRT